MFFNDFKHIVNERHEGNLILTVCEAVNFIA